ncbi:unnamed protein product [Prunus armeniaca]
MGTLDSDARGVVYARRNCHKRTSTEDSDVRARSPVSMLDGSSLSTWLLRIPSCGSAKRSLVGLFPLLGTWILGYVRTLGTLGSVFHRSLEG